MTPSNRQMGRRAVMCRVGQELERELGLGGCRVGGT